MPELRITQFGGVNYNDPSDTLFSKAFNWQGSNPFQVAPMESKAMRNIDFFDQGPGKRQGSAADATFNIQVVNEVGNPKNFAINDIAYGNGVLIAVGVADGTDPYMIRSTDGGENWVEVAQAITGNIALTSIAYGVSTWIAVGGAKIIKSQDDGVSWAAGAPGITAPDVWRTVAFGGGEFMLVWNDNSKAKDQCDFWNPTDGVTIFSKDVTGTTSDIVTGGAYGAGSFVVTYANSGETTGGIAYCPSRSGSFTDAGTISASSSIRALHYANSIFVAVGDSDGTNAAIFTATSPSGTWTERSPAVDKNVDLNDVTYIAGIWWTVGDADAGDGYMLFQIDPTGSWTEKANGKNFGLNCVAGAGAALIAMGVADGTDAYALESHSTIDILLAGHAFIPSGTTTEVEIIVSNTTIYKDGTALKDPSNTETFAWGTTPTKCTIVEHDGRVFICTDTNPIVVYRTGLYVDNNLYNVSTSTTVDADSASGQKVLSVAATTMFNVYDRVIINSGGAREETGTIDSISAGASITLMANLASAHTLLQADVVTVQNQYTETYTGTARTVTGEWKANYYNGLSFQGRLLINNGDNVVEYLPVDKPYDRANGGYDVVRANVVALESWLPKGQNDILQLAVYMTEAGVEFKPGFDLSDVPFRSAGTQAPLNYRCSAVIENWVVYLNEGGLEATNGQHTIDLGRRFFAHDGATGPMDSIKLSSTRTNGFLHYYAKKKQLFAFVTDGTNTNNGRCMVLDFQLGEPVPGEPKESFEKRVRCLDWSVFEPDSNPWFNHMYDKRGDTVGVVSSGVTYKINSGTEDFGSVSVVDYMTSADIDGGVPEVDKQWERMTVFSQKKGAWPLYCDHFKEGATTAEKTWNFQQTVTSGNIVKGTDSDTDIYSSFMSFKLRNQNVGESWVIRSAIIKYSLGTYQA